MKNLLQTAMKHYLCCELLKVRHRLGLTQKQMAARLWMSTRSYTALEGGQACFGLATFLLFLFRCCRTEEETKAFWAACAPFSRIPSRTRPESMRRERESRPAYGPDGAEESYG